MGWTTREWSLDPWEVQRFFFFSRVAVGLTQLTFWYCFLGGTMGEFEPGRPLPSDTEL